MVIPARQSPELHFRPCSSGSQDCTKALSSSGRGSVLLTALGTQTQITGKGTSLWVSEKRSEELSHTYFKKLVSRW